MKRDAGQLECRRAARAEPHTLGPPRALEGIGRSASRTMDPSTWVIKLLRTGTWELEALLESCL